MPAARNRLSILLAFAALYVVWGSTYLGILFAIQTIPPFLMAGTRFVCAGILMYAAARVTGTPRPERSTWKSAAIIGAFLLLCGNGAVTIAERWVPTGLAALLVATVPIDIALLGWLSGDAPRPTPLAGVGLLGGFVGVGVLAGPAIAIRSPTNHLGLGMSILLIGSFMWSIGSLCSRKIKHASSLVLAAGQQMICGGAFLLLAGMSLGESRGFHITQVSAQSLLAFAYLVLIGAIVGYTAYFYLLRHVDPAKVATYAYINPVVAIVLGTLFAGERLDARTAAGATLIVGSVALVIAAQRFQPPTEEAR